MTSRLTLIEKLNEKTNDKHILGLYQCSCGKQKRLPISRVKHGYVMSCGCLAHDTKPNLTHGMKYSKTYSTWSSIKNRCTCSTSKDFKRYGASGIKLCDRWMVFENFLADMGERPPKTSIDRIDNTKGYEPGNCRWATTSQQRCNTSNSYLFFIQGLVFESSEEAAKHFNVKRQTIFKWVDGWFDKRRNKQWSAKNECYRVKKYPAVK